MPTLTALSLARLPMILLLTMCLLAATACSGAETPAGGDAQSPASIPPSFVAGETLFNANCALCHGEGAVGTQSGPPLIHRVYEPGHHPDFAFHNAVNKGVAAHHWPYGDMPPVPGLSAGDVESIICYVRELQRAEGIPVRDTC